MKPFTIADMKELSLFLRQVQGSCCYLFLGVESKIKQAIHTVK